MQGIEAFAMVSTFGIIGATVVNVARAFFNRGTRRPLPAPADPMLQERLDRLENAIQSIAIETERIAEGQRFTTRLLSEHGSPVAQATGRALPSFAEAPLPAARQTQRSAVG